MDKFDSAALGRSVLGIIMGIVVGGILISLCEMLGHRLFPVPPEIGTISPDRCSDAIKLLRPIHLWSVIFAWFFGATAGGALAAAVAKGSWFRQSAIVSAFFLSGGIFTVTHCTHPTWFVVIGLGSFLPAAILGSRLAAAAAERTAA